MLKRFLSLLLCAALMLTLLPAAAHAEDAGTCRLVLWPRTLDETGVEDPDLTGGMYYCKINGHGTSAGHYLYFDPEIGSEIEVTLQVFKGYDLVGFSVNNEPVEGDTYTAILTGDTTIDIYFRQNNDTVPITLEVGEGREDEADTIREALGSVFPDAELTGTLISFTDLKAQTVGELWETVNEVIEEETELGDLCLMTPKDNWAEAEPWLSAYYGDKVGQERLGDDGLDLYVLWYEILDEINITVDPPVCGTEVGLEADLQSYSFTQTNGPVAYAEESDVTFEGYWYDEEWDPFAGTIAGGEAYMVFLEMKGGYLFSEGAVVAVNGEEPFGFLGSQLAAYITAEHDWDDGTVSDEGDEIVYQCRHCEATKTESLTAGPTFVRQSLILTGQIGVNFFVDLNGLNEEEREASYMTFDITGMGTVAERDDFDPECVSETEEGCYGFTCYVNSIQMADTITATFHYPTDDGEGTVVKEYSVEQYIQDYDKYIVGTDEEDGDTTTLVHALASYGYHVQNFLSEENGWEFDPETGYTEMTECYTTLYDIDSIKQETEGYKFEWLVYPGDRIGNVSLSLTLDSETAINLYFRLGSGYGESVEAEIYEEDGMELVDGEYELVTEADGRVRLTISGIPASRLADTYEILLTIDDEPVEVHVPALAYVNMLLNSGAYADNRKAQKAAASLFMYYKAASSWLEGHSY